VRARVPPAASALKNDQPPPASTSATSVTASQLVQRPEPGLARGHWEAPAWAFWTIALAALAACVGWGVLAYRRSTGGRRKAR
jgi:hypothetical protein